MDKLTDNLPSVEDTLEALELLVHDTRTITVKSALGNDKQVTKDEYVTQWASAFTQFGTLPVTSEGFEKYKQIKQWVHKQAAEAFESVYAAQNNKAPF